jgi:hypothetical protein
LVTIGVGYDKSQLGKMLAADEVRIPEWESLFEFSIELSRADSPFEDITHRSYINGRGAAKLELDYWVVKHRKFQIRTEYRTDDAQAQDRMRILLSIIDGYFQRGLEVVDLQSGKVLREDITDEDDTKSYSRKFRDWCFAMPKRYLYVWYEECADGSAGFVGVRPLH